MSLPSSSNEPFVPTAHRPARPNVYTVMLVIALLAMIVACVCLWGENADYDWKYKGGPTVSTQGPGE